MARKVTISKEMILDAALRMLIRDGYQTVNIKTLAAEIGCSTQPIAWHFENMEGLRKALAQYAKDHSRKRIGSGSENAVDAFERMGREYIRMATDEPNLFRFLYLGESPLSRTYTMSDLFGDENENSIAEKIAEQTGLPVKSAVRCIQNTVIYSHGLATMIATGVFKASPEDAMFMIKAASESFVMKERMTDHEL